MTKVVPRLEKQCVHHSQFLSSLFVYVSKSRNFRNYNTDTQTPGLGNAKKSESGFSVFVIRKFPIFRIRNTEYGNSVFSVFRITENEVWSLLL